jgi:cobalt/nickel transport system permease protein
MTVLHRYGVPREHASVPPRGPGALRGRGADALAFVLRSARYTPEKGGIFHFSPPVKLALASSLVFFISASSNFAFVAVTGVVLLAYLATLDGRRILRIVTPPLEAFLASLLILAPSLLWGQTRAFWVVPIKTLATTTVLSLLAHSMNWNRFTCAFKSFGLPNALIFIFDLTLKYVVVFSEICLETFDALRLRSVGRNRAKARSLGAIAGLTFLRAQDAAREQFDAMTCRCFSGVYRRYRAPFRVIDAFGIAIILGALCAYVYFERFAHV